MLNLFAPAKINLYLHVTRQRDDGYHDLDTLVAFADIGDEITLTPADTLSFSINGPFARHFKARERDHSPDSANLLIRALWDIARLAGKEPNFDVQLTKNLPLAAGIGGGSSDAAAVIWGLLQLWDLDAGTPELQSILMALGADVPVCLSCQPAHIIGIGDHFTPVPALPEIPVVLVNPGKPCLTKQVFAYHDKAFQEAALLPADLSSMKTLTAFLEDQSNDLLAAACQQVPDIENVLGQLRVQAGCTLARMSGSGATCFALFETEDQAKFSAGQIQNENPDWWVQSGMLNAPARY